MKLSKLYKNCKPTDLTQGFHDGHKANDWASSYGTFLVAICNSKVDGITTAENIDKGEELSRGYGIRLISTEDPSFSYTIWHCQPFFPVKAGDIVLQGEVVAQMGNSGFVLSNGVYVEIDRRTLPPFPGTHTHISCGTKNPDGTYTAQDLSKLIDWSIPITYDIMTTVSAFIISITNFLRK